MNLMCAKGQKERKKKEQEGQNHPSSLDFGWRNMIMKNKYKI